MISLKYLKIKELKLIYKKIIYVTIYFFLFNCSSEISKNNISNGIFKKQTLRIGVIGDVMIHNIQISSAYTASCDCYDFTPNFKNILPLTKNIDYGIGNLETTLPGNKKDYSGYPTFGSPDSILDALKDINFTILTTSNNHCLDKGMNTFIRTINEIKKRNMYSTGTFFSEEERLKNRYLIFEKNGIKFLLLSYTYGTNGISIPKNITVNLINKVKIKEDIENAKKENPDFIIVYYHFGLEYERLPNDEQKNLVEFTFGEGADIVLGGHPHVLQPYELKYFKDRDGVSKKRLVVYSLGNFISSQYWRYSNGGIIFYFSLNKLGSSTFIDEIDYEPVFVFRSIKSGKLEFQLLPIKKYIEENFPPFINEKIKKQMIEFFTDTRDHFMKYSHVE